MRSPIGNHRWILKNLLHSRILDHGSPMFLYDGGDTRRQLRINKWERDYNSFWFLLLLHFLLSNFSMDSLSLDYSRVHKSWIVIPAVCFLNAVLPSRASLQNSRPSTSWAAYDGPVRHFLECEFYVLWTADTTLLNSCHQPA